MGIEDAIYEKRSPEHVDSRRTLTVMFNDDLGGFVARQVKTIETHQDAVLGNHYHSYREAYQMLQGSAVVVLEDVDTKERKQFELSPKDRILVPARVAHKVMIKGGSILLGCSEVPYVSSESNDIKYAIGE